MARMRELARCGALVCGSGRTGAIQSLSPHELAEWCRSLASCGVRGVLLASLQAAVLTQHIDGKRFDEMLNNGDLLRLGVQDLNPRLIVAIRKVWRTDFGHVCFVPYSTPTVVPPEKSISPQPLSNMRPLPKPFSSARDRLDSGLSCSREPPIGIRQTRSAGDRSCPSYEEALGCLSVPPLERADGRDTFHSYAQMPVAASQVADIVASPPCQEQDSLDALLPAKPQAKTSFAPPQPMSVASSQQFANEPAGTSLADVFAPRQKAAVTFAAQAQDQNNSADFPRKKSLEASEWKGISLTDALKSSAHTPPQTGIPSVCESMPSSSKNSDPPRSRAAVSKKDPVDWNGQGLGDVFAPKKAAPRTFASSSDTQTTDVVGARVDVGIASQRKLDTGFGGNSLGDVLQSARREPAVAGSIDSQRPQEDQVLEQRRQHKPSEDVWGGASLGDALVARTKVVPSQPEALKEKPQVSNVGANNSNGGGGANQKTQQQIVEWLRSLPLSHLPEQPREGIIEIVEGSAMTGNSFTEFVQKVDPAVCGPKHAMKLKAAWNNVLAEAAATEVCRQNLDYAASHSKKAVAIKISA